MAATQPCHNCRRQRLKCDRSLPQCLKCTRRGQECLGYQRLFRWAQGVASRGKMAGKTFEEMSKVPTVQAHLTRQNQFRSTISTQQHLQEDHALSLPRPLTDPLVQDVSQASRKYLHYFAIDVCKDLVLYDIPKHNHFRKLIPMTQENPILLQIIIANAALHMSNACQRSLGSILTSSPSHYRKSLLDSTYLASSTIRRSEFYNDALAAKQRALHLLQAALASLSSVDIDVTLAVVLLFIEFELIDSGRDSWKPHIHGARTIIDRLCRSNVSMKPPLSPLRSCLISNCLVFDILGSSLASSMGLVASDTMSLGALSLLLDEEGNHCSSFPVRLLQLIRAGAQLLQPDPLSLPGDFSADAKAQRGAELLHSAHSFDALNWATNIQQRSPATDLQHRAYIASAHRAAVCIYLSRVLLSVDPNAQISQDLESLVTEITEHVSFVRPSDPLFTAITWPVFVAGAETSDRTRQEWVTIKFQELWEVEPWGLMRGALEVLERIWARKESYVLKKEGQAFSREKPQDGDWVGELRGMGVDWLII